MKEKRETEQQKYEELCADFKKLKENLKYARKNNLQAEILSVIALVISGITLVIRILLAQ